MIADLANRSADAARLYGIAENEMPQLNLRLAQVLASWQTRSGHPAAAQRLLAKFAASAPDIGIALPALIAAGGNRPVARASEGIAEAYLALSAALRGQDSDEYAILMLRLSLDLRPGFTPARLLASDVLAGNHHAAAALRMLAGVPSADPLQPRCPAAPREITQSLGRTEDAMRDLDRIAAEYPDSAMPAMEQGEILRTKQRYAEAITAYSRAIAHLTSPGRADWLVFYERAIAYEQAHHWREAEADFRHALALAPDQPSVLNYLGYSWAEKGENLAEARQMVQKAAAGRPNDGAIIDSLGWVMLRQGQVADAVKTLERAVELQPEELDDQRASWRRLLGRWAQPGGAIPVAPGADTEPGAGGHGETGGQAADTADRGGGQRAVRRHPRISGCCRMGRAPRHGRPCAGHPRLVFVKAVKPWMAATRRAMTERAWLTQTRG